MGSTKKFSYQWQKFHKLTPAYEEQFLRWVHPLKQKDFKNKVVLDAGCGAGRNSYWPLKYGATFVDAFDYDRKTVAVAKKNLQEFKNKEVSYGSIYTISYKEKFDISFSIGVIHHLENPKKAVKHLVDLTKKGGIILIWVYGDSNGSLLIKGIKLIRQITKHLPLQVVNILAFLLTIPLFLYLKLIPQKHPYTRVLSSFHFWHVRSIVFDQLIPEIAHYWNKNEALDLFADLPVSAKIYATNANSWTVIAKKH